MNVREFAKEMQDYYGMQYPEGAKRRIAAYLAQFTEAALDQLADLTIKTFSGRFRALPDIAVWEELRADVQTRLEYTTANLNRLALEDLADPDAETNLAAAIEAWADKMKLKGAIKP